jgi:hypothetical protein
MFVNLLLFFSGFHINTALKNAGIFQNWHSLSLIETLLELSASDEHYDVVRSLFDYPAKHCPEILLLGLAQAKVHTHFISNLFH